jgi:hypothetical protein
MRLALVLAVLVGGDAVVLAVVVQPDTNRFVMSNTALVLTIKSRICMATLRNGIVKRQPHAGNDSMRSSSSIVCDRQKRLMQRSDCSRSRRKRQSGNADCLSEARCEGDGDGSTGLPLANTAGMVDACRKDHGGNKLPACQCVLARVSDVD